MDKKYTMVLDADSITYAFTPSTMDATGYRTQITIQSNKDVTWKIQYSSDGTTWLDTSEYTGLTVSSSSSYSDTVIHGGYLRIGGICDNSGETDTITITITLLDATPTYCTAQDVVRTLQLRDSDGSAFTPSTTTIPTLEDFNQTIIEAEEEINAITRHSWKTERATNEMRKLQMNPMTLDKWVYGECMINLRHRDIHTPVTGSDTYEIWDGSTYTDLIANYTEGRENDYWIDYNQGIIYFRKIRPRRWMNSLRANYNWGADSVPADIRKATMYLAAVSLLLSDPMCGVVPEGGNMASPIERRIQLLQERADKILENRKEIRGV